MKKYIILFLLIAAAITARGQNQNGVEPSIQEIESYLFNGDEDDFAYNANGCMTKDLTKGIRKIEYNALNLPQKIYIKNSEIEAIFEYNYLANGVKVRTVKRWNPGTPTAGKEVNEASLTDSLQTDYLGNKIYENGELKTILVDGGYYDCEKEKYFFYLTDHLGNNRVVADEDGNIVETNHYYPFGETFAENTNQNVQPYKYNGKELNKDLNLYDYSARHYAPNIGRFTTMDPHAENYYSVSPYAYVGNNPLRYIDPTGMDWIITTEHPNEVSSPKVYKSELSTNLMVQGQYIQKLGLDMNKATSLTQNQFKHIIQMYNDNKLNKHLPSSASGAGIGLLFK